jgi:hypothetical protein
LKNHNILAKHIERTCKFKTKTNGWIIYRILAPEEIKELSIKH